MNNYYIFLFVFIFNFIGFAQENIVKHTVSDGETVISIAQKYKVTPNDLYKLNPDLANGIKVNSVINIPKSDVVSLKKVNNSTPISPAKSNDILQHLVQRGETKFGLSKRYGVSISQLEQQNPHILTQLQAGHKLEIRGGFDSNPQGNKTAVSANQFSEFITYEVLPRETLYGISKRYGLTVEELVDANSLTGILKSGQTLRIPIRKGNDLESKDATYHLVEAGETKYGLSKRYGISIEELENRNPQIVKMLQTGQRLIIPGKNALSVVSKPEVKLEPKVLETPKVEEIKLETKVIESPVTVETSKPEAVQPETKIEKVSETEEVKPETKIAENNTKAVDADLNKVTWVDYEVQPKETLYGLSKMAGISQEKLIEVNPNLKEGVKSGVKIKIPSDKIPVDSHRNIPTSSENIETKIEEIGLLKTINKIEKKDIVFLNSFTNENYLNFIQNPSSVLDDTKEFEFFAGANFAIDSLKKMGVMVEMKNVQVEFSKDSKIEVSSLKKNNVDKSKALFYYSEEINSEKIADFASKNNIPFIVNKVEEGTEKSSTTFVSIPSKNDLALTVIKYIADKKGNLIVVSDAISALNEDFILQNFPKARFVKISGKDALEAESLTKELILNRKNFVLLNTDKIGLILNATTALLKESKEYDIQLALLEPKEVIEKEGLSEMRFKVLNTIYPSYSKRDNLDAINKFKSDFKNKYSFDPTEEAIQGFDITFDALIRLFQDKSFEATAKDEVTEQLYYKFQYFKSPNGGYTNKGVYILQFDSDSNIKVVN